MVGGRQQISVVDGEIQDSAAHARRGVGPAVDVPAAEGQEVQAPVAGLTPWFGSDAENGNYAMWSWQGLRGRWVARYAHLQAFGALLAGHTGTASGPHVHLCLWLDGVRVRPEDQPEFIGMLG